MSHKAQARGFTLIEVLVALIIVAFGMGALLATLSSAADTAGVLRDKAFAQWIAMNRISELRLRSIRPDVGKTAGDVEFAGQNWRWSQEVLDPGIAGMLRIDVSVTRASAVSARDKSPPALAMATGFVGTAILAGNGLEPDWSPHTYQQTAPSAGSPSGTPGAPSPGTNPATSPGAAPPVQGERSTK